ncbi:ABC transporter substrate-binding protein [Jiangella alba]|uniref:Carbohydrate ABC transporter substrate-binding protein, CUT1 family n=1 Tax=Jiangella alba TaxID=561176 RepID=A0A1H5JM39_9ACTN|nr:ABC transporter substrate-binding protein [Jiangella alba]SEE52698.1 carbohydrate ABC transporter substrate-binding protein, CUT1 family [Jiangella alba]
MTQRSGRRTVAVLGVAASVSLLTAACTGSDSAGTDGDDGGGAASEISVWFPGANQAEIDLVNDTIVPAFEEETGATVEVTFVDWGDLSPKLNAAFAAGTAPDVFGHGPAAVADFVATDRLTDLGPYLAELDPAVTDDLGAALAGGQVDGTQYLIPLSMQGNLVMYNAADFTAAGLDPDAPPTTWEGIRAAAEQLTVRDGDTVTHAGLLVPSNPIAIQQTFASLLSGAGGDMLEPDGSAATFDTPEGTQALEFFVDLFHGEQPVSNMLGEDYVNMPPAQQPLVVGDASMAVLTAPVMQQVAEAAPDLDLRVMPAPTFEGADSPAMIGGAGPGLMINKDSPAQDLAWDFIEYLLTPEVMAEYTAGIGAVPVHASAIDTEYVRSNPVVQAFVEQASALKPNPNVPGWVEIRDALDANLEQALHETVDVGTALDNATAEVESIIAQHAGG